MTILYLIVAAACGGAIRFATEYKFPPVGPHAFPRATLMVNVVGTFLLGVMSVLSSDLRIVIGVGLCGALTTFSGVSLQLHRRIIARSWKSAFVYLMATLIAGFVAGWLGIHIGEIILQ